MSVSKFLLALAAGVIILLTGPSRSHAAPPIKDLLARGELAQAEDDLLDHLLAEPQDDLARFQLGTVQLLRAAERLIQDGGRLGVTRALNNAPFFRLGRLSEVQAEPVTYGDIRTVFTRFQSSVATAEATLAQASDRDLYWPVELSKVAIDFNDDDKLAPEEHLETLFDMVTDRRWRPREREKPSTKVGLDSADLYWLRGYCHALQAMADIVLAYDHQRVFDLTAHAFFANPQTEFAKRRIEQPADPKRRSQAQMERIADVIAAIHLADLPLREPERMRNAHLHMLEMVKLSRKNWELISQEDDNRNEWIPNANQTSIIPGLTVDQQRLDAWHLFLNEAEAILQGKRLLPFWRSDIEGGINLERVFNKPRSFDLVLWAQGAEALPYLEKGVETDPQMWREFRRIFRGDFLSFALWVN